MRSTVLGYLLATACISAPQVAAQYVPRRLPPGGPSPVELQRQKLKPDVWLMNDSARPTNVSATLQVLTNGLPNRVTLTWSPVPGSIGYDVQRAPAAAGPFQRLTPAMFADTQFTDSSGGLDLGSTHFYRVGSYQSDSTYGRSDPVTVTFPKYVAVDPGAQPILRRLEPVPPPPPPPPSPPPPPLFGFADLHTHQVANYGFGGLFFWGDAADHAHHGLQPCDQAHGPGGTQDFIGTAMGMGANHRTGGFPHFDGWPMWYSINHQQMHIDWLKRAVDGGLRLMVLDAVNNELYCEIYRKAAWVTNCDDMALAEFQINMAKGIEQRVDNLNGGQGRGWYRIVYSAQQARSVISQGKLAVVLGIEVDDVLNCRGCSTSQVRQRLQRIYDLGVRKLNPVHLADNDFGGSALYNPLFQFNNFFHNKRFITAFDCSNRGIQYRFDPVGDVRMTIVNALMPFMTARLGLPPGAMPPQSNGGQCNVLDLTPNGRFLIHEMMSKHMIVDVAHMGLRTLESTLAITDANDYPVVSSHSGLLDLAVGGKRSERALSNSVIATIKKSGGLIGLGIGGGGINDVKSGATRIPNDCGHTTKTFAQEYLTAINRLQGSPVALGSDLNGLEKMTAPRFGNDACARHPGAPQPASSRVAYPFTGHGTNTVFHRMVSGTRTFDYNTDGFAQVGMYPDFVEDLKRIGLTTQELDPLFKSADAFVRLWEKAESRAIQPLASNP